MLRFLVSFALSALALPALADEPLLKSQARSEPPLVPSAYSTSTTPAPQEEPATAAEAAEQAAQPQPGALDPGLAPPSGSPREPAAPAPSPSAPTSSSSGEVEESGPDVLFGSKAASGGFGGLTVKTSRVAGDAAVLVGGRGAWLIDHRLALGFAGYGLASEVPVLDGSDGRSKFVEMAYGGFYGSYALFPSSLVHVSIDGLVGAGGTTYSRRYYSWDGSDSVDESGDGFFVGEVGANVVVNVAKYARLSIGPGWRFVNGARYRKIRSDDFSGPQGSITMDFGKF